MKIQVNVTEQDIKEGVRKHCEKCPVALAAQRAVVGSLITKVGAGYKYLTVTMVSGLYFATIAAPLPQIALAFVSGFDMGRVLSPFSFELEIPDRFFPEGWVGTSQGSEVLASQKQEEVAL